MRLIDADKLYPDCLTKYGRLAISQSQIANAPIVEDRSKGKWKEYKLRNDIVVEYAFKCSNCKKDSGLVYRTDFCPNCGADMRGKEE